MVKRLIGLLLVCGSLSGFDRGDDSKSDQSWCKPKRELIPELRQVKSLRDLARFDGQVVTGLGALWEKISPGKAMTSSYTGQIRLYAYVKFNTEQMCALFPICTYSGFCAEEFIAQALTEVKGVDNFVRLLNSVEREILQKALINTKDWMPGNPEVKAEVIKVLSKSN